MLEVVEGGGTGGSILLWPSGSAERGAVRGLTGARPGTAVLTTLHSTLYRLNTAAPLARYLIRKQHDGSRERQTVRLMMRLIFVGVEVVATGVNCDSVLLTQLY